MRHPFDLAAYGYRGPQGPEEKSTLTIDIGSALGDQLVAAVRDAVRAETVPPPPDPPQPPDPPPPADDPPAATEPDTPEVTGSTHDQPETGPDDEWAAMVAHLTPDPATTTGRRSWPT